MSARKKQRRSSNRPKHRRSVAKKAAAASPGEQKQFLERYDARDFTAAQNHAETLTRRYPRDAFGWKVLGSCLHKNGHIERSREVLGRALELDAADAQAQHLMARAWYDLGAPNEALAFAREAVRLEPEFAQGHFTLAEILSESDRDEQALTHALRAEALGHEESACLFMRGHVYTKRRRYQDAFETIQRLIEREPDNAFAQNEIGNLYKDLGRFDEAEAAYRKALELNPQFDTAFSNLLICMHYDPAVSAQRIFETIGQWENHFPSQAERYPHASDPARADKIIRIGMVSPGFRMHPVGQMILTGLEQIGPGFELYFYSTNNAEDALTRRLTNIATSWNLVRHLSQDELADRIYEDGIDILIDLSGYGEGSRLRTMARKPAPLIVKWVGGLINTMGLSAFDYLISDHNETPPGVDDAYTEKLIRLPNDYICYLPAPDAPPITALPVIGNGYITLGCFNNPAKINPVLLGEWARLMHELPGSRLLLKSGQYDSPEYCERIRSIMAGHGVTADRLMLEGPSRHRELLEAYNRVDIALDTWPYSGGLTTCEAFMMGVPVVTYPGPTFAGRHSATHLINAGMPELVTDSWDQYRQKVLELASDIPNLSVIRACLRNFLIQSPVCDAARFGHHFSYVMRAIWRRHCSRQLPAELTFSSDKRWYFDNESFPLSESKFSAAGSTITMKELINSVPARLVQWTRTFSALTPENIDAIVKACEQTLCETPSHNKAFFALTFALLAEPVRSLGRTRREIELRTRLEGFGWLAKENLYRYWLAEADTLRRVETPDIGIVVIANRFEQEIFFNLKELSEQGKGKAQIVFVNNGAANATFECLEPFVDVWLKTTGNAGAYLARNLGALYSDAPLLLFVDDDGFPNPGFVEAHLDMHEHRIIASLRGVYKAKDRATEPPHYYQGNQLTIAPPELEGNVSFSLDIFKAAGGWGDYILFGHGGLDIMHKMIEHGVPFEKQLYSPAPVLNHEYFKGARHAKDKLSKQQASAELLWAYTPGLANNLHSIKQYKSTELRPLPQEPGLALPEEEARYLETIYQQSDNILEYGSGGSTFLAARMKNKAIFSVESDLSWAENITACVEAQEFDSIPYIHHVNIGQTGAWGKPIDAKNWFNYYKYPMSVWDLKWFKQPSVILIDGRFRIACFLTAYMRIKKPTVVLFDDYANRSYYHEVERLVTPTTIVGRMARFDLQPTKIPKEHLTWIIGSFNRVTLAN